MLERLLKVAVERAPSAHNTQAWQLEQSGNGVKISLLARRQLPIVDPVHRQHYESIGTLGATLVELALAQGSSLRTWIEDDALHAEPGPARPPEPWRGRAVLRRRTDRAAYRSTRLSAAQKQTLQDAVPAGTGLCWLDSAKERATVVACVEGSIQRMFASVPFWRELVNALTPGWDGQPPDATAPAPSEAQLRRDATALAKSRAATVRASGSLVMLSTREDSPAAWIEAGFALGSLWLRATSLGLSAQPLNLAVEDERARSRLAKLSHGLPQAVLRLGQGGKGDAPPPRRPFSAFGFSMRGGK